MVKYLHCTQKKLKLTNITPPYVMMEGPMLTMVRMTTLNLAKEEVVLPFKACVNVTLLLQKCTHNFAKCL